jgi:hypothetical protein
MQYTNLKLKLRIGYFVFASLVSIKIGEYLTSTIIHSGIWPYLLVQAVTSAWLIIYYFKHIRDLWHSEDKENE